MRMHVMVGGLQCSHNSACPFRINQLLCNQLYPSTFCIVQVLFRSLSWAISCLLCPALESQEDSERANMKNVQFQPSLCKPSIYTAQCSNPSTYEPSYSFLLSQPHPKTSPTLKTLTLNPLAPQKHPPNPQSTIAVMSFGLKFL